MKRAGISAGGEVAGVVTGYDAENRRLLCVQRNKFAVGQPLELVLPLQGWDLYPGKAV